MAVVEVCDYCRKEISQSFIPRKITVEIPVTIFHHATYRLCSLECLRDLVLKKIGGTNGKDRQKEDNATVQPD